MASRFVEAGLSNTETKKKMFPSRMLLARSVWKGILDPT